MCGIASLQALATTLTIFGPDQGALSTQRTIRGNISNNFGRGVSICARTMKTEKMHFISRTRQRIWKTTMKIEG